MKTVISEWRSAITINNNAERLMKTMLKSNQGMAMVLVLAITVLLLAITGGVLLFSGLNLKIASNMRTGMPLIQVADAGIQHALAVVSQGSGFSYSSETTVVSTTNFPAGSQYTYVVTALNGPGSDQATFTSTTHHPNNSKPLHNIDMRYSPSCID